MGAATLRVHANAAMITATQSAATAVEAMQPAPLGLQLEWREGVGTAMQCFP